MEFIEGNYGQSSKIPKEGANEILRGFNCATALHDTIAWAAFAAKAEDFCVVFSIRDLLSYMSEAAGILEGWKLSEPALASLHEKVNSFLQMLRKNDAFDISDFFKQH